MAAEKKLFTGLSGIQLPISKYDYPVEFADSSRLTYYSSLFNSIEINSSFYKLPMKRTVIKWRDSVGDSFKFTFKLAKDITHCTDFNFECADVDRFFQAINEVKPKHGCLLVQFPPKLKNDYFTQLEKLLHYLDGLSILRDWHVAIEFRDKGWYNEETYNLTTAYRSTVVLHDIPKSASPFRTPEVDHVYLRFHGPTGNYRGSYSDFHLAEYAGYAKEWLEEGKTVYVYFNNTNGEGAYQNLVTFNRYMRQPP